VHDEILLEAPEDAAEQAAQILQQVDGAGWTEVFKKGASESGGSDRSQLGGEIKNRASIYLSTAIIV
jgi:hypothetical protein